MVRGFIVLILGVAIGTLATADDAPVSSPVSTPAFNPERMEVDDSGREGALDQGGETCASATVIAGLPYCDTGTTTGFANNYTPPCITASSAPDVVYVYTPPTSQVVSFSLCGSSYNTALHIWRGCPTSGGMVVACNDNSCGSQSCCQGVNLLTGQQYYIIVDGGSGGTTAGTYVLNVVTGQSCPSTLCDQCPYPDHDLEPANNSCSPNAGTIACADSLCGLIATAADVDWYNLTITGTQCMTLTVDVFGDDTPGLYPFGRGLDPKVALVAADCATLLAQDDNGGTGNDAHLVSECLSPGTYRIRVEQAITTLPGGPYILAVACTPCPCPCVVECPTGGMPENEPCPNIPDNYNGGCNSTPPVFRPISCGQTICGTAAIDASSFVRDTDWFSFSLNTRDSVRWCVEAEFPVEVMIMRPGPVGCPDRDTLVYVSGSACAQICAAACLDPGTYALYVAPLPAQVGLPCSDYVARLACLPCETQDLCPYPNQDNEPANNYCSAPGQTLLCGDTLCGAIAPLGDSDWYVVNIVNTPCGRITIDVFGNDTPGWWPAGQGLDPRVWLYASDCSTILAFDDNGGTGNDSRLVSPCLPPGVYRIRIDATGAVAPTTGPYILATACEPCVCQQPCNYVCPPNAILENEPCPNVPDNFNSGCDNGTPNVPTRPIQCGQQVCGRLWAENNALDSDWWLLNTVESDTLMWCVWSEIPITTYIFAAGPGSPCIGLDTLACVSSSGCDTVCIGACVAPGTYAFKVEPDVPGPPYPAIPCSTLYVGRLICTICSPDIPEVPDSLVIHYPDPAVTDIELHWAAMPGVDEYYIYRSSNASQNPSPGTFFASTTDTHFTDIGAIGNPGMRQFYTVVAHRHRAGCR